MLPEALLDAPQVGGLPGERGAIDGAQPGEAVGVVGAEVGVDRLIGGQAEEGADDLNGHGRPLGSIAVMEDRRGAPLTHALTAEPVINQAEHGDEEGATIHRTTSMTQVNLSHFTA